MTNMTRIFRTLTSKYPYKEYHPDDKKFTINACHWGQLKLFYTELEFLAICSKYYDMAKCVVVYVGAAPGNHTEFLTKLFPELHWILYDPAKFFIERSDKIEIFTGRDGYFTDATVEQVKKNKRTHGKHILFISDIRMGNDDKDEFEIGVWNDMIQQQQWAIKLNCTMAMLKLRFPYIFDNKVKIDKDYDMSQISDHIKINKHYPDSVLSLLYLEGEIFIQINPPINSTETRLIIRQNPDKTYNMRYYDAKMYEGQLFYFNTVDRIETEYEYRDSEKLKNHLAGFDNSYDRVSEFYIWSRYLKYYLKEEYDFDKLVKFIYDLHDFLDKTTHRNILTCKIDTLDKRKLHNKDKLLENKNVIIAESRDMIYTLKNQISLIKYHNEKILDKNEYDTQIRILRNSAGSIEKIMDKKIMPFLNRK